MITTPLRSTLILSALLLGTTPVLAQDVCETSEAMSLQRLARRASLDLRDTIPNLEEIETIREQAPADATTLPAFVADALVESEEFLGVMRRYHEELLWPNIDQVELIPQTHQLFPVPIIEGEAPIYLSGLRAVFTRAAPNGTNLFLPCKGEPAQFDGEGNLIVEPVMMGDVIIGYQEGYVEVEPYWAPGTTVRVCGLDAQPASRAVVCPGPVERYPFIEATCQQIGAVADQFTVPEYTFRGSEVDCNSPFATFAPGCGCGENLRYCQTPETDRAIRASMFEQQYRLIERVIRDNRPYEEILLEQELDFNGPISHYLNNQANLSLETFTQNDPSALAPQNLTYADTDTWVTVARQGRHSGVLTTPGYLLRFTTWRGRAHRFYNAFECSSLIPNGPLPSPFEACSQEADLTKRCGCDACHKTLEPMAAHWGRFSEFGYASLDEEEFPVSPLMPCIRTVDGEPALAAEDAEGVFRCFQQYDFESFNLRAYTFRTPAQITNIVQGPAKLVNESVQSGRFSGCTTRKMWSYFMRREPTADEEAKIIPELTQTFDSSGHNLKSLIKAIVTHPAYGRQL